MAEILRSFEEPVLDRAGGRWSARACGAAGADGHWEGWIEFVSDGGFEAARTSRETTQPSRDAARYWAGGLTHVYLEGALERALEPAAPHAPPPRQEPPLFAGPAPAARPSAAPALRPVLDPFSVYAKGEELLRQELGALHPRHLRTIARAFRLVDERRLDLDGRTREELTELIMAGVRELAPLANR